MKSSPVLSFSLVSFGIAAATTLVFWLRFGLEPLPAWLAAINLTAFMVYGADKTLAQGRRVRVPEKVLLLLALFFGSLGAWLGMQFFRHKTAKQSFNIKLWLVVVIQAALILLYYLVIRPIL